MENINSIPQENLEQFRNKKLSEIEPIEEHHVDVETREDLSQLIEGPLLSACQNLYDKNVQTYMSSANKKNIESGDVEFSIIYNTLSEKNREVAKRLIEEKVLKLTPANEVSPSRLQVNIPVTETTTWGEIEEASLKIADRFVPQRLMPEGYAPEYLMEYLAPAIEEDVPEGDVTPEYFERHGYFYEPRTGVFFKSKGDRDKALETIEGEDGTEPPKFSHINKSFYGE
jgi:hypothetical protein